MEYMYNLQSCSVDHAWLPVDVFMCTVSTPLYAWSVILSILTMGSVYKCKEQEEGIP